MKVERSTFYLIASVTCGTMSTLQTIIMIMGVPGAFDVILTTMWMLLFTHYLKNFLGEHRVNFGMITITTDENGNTNLEDLGTKHVYDFKKEEEEHDAEER